LGKNVTKSQGGTFLTHTVDYQQQLQVITALTTPVWCNERLNQHIL